MNTATPQSIDRWDSDTRTKYTHRPSYSPLNDPHRCPLDAIQIDRSFVAACDDAENREILWAMAGLARSLGIGMQKPCHGSSIVPLDDARDGTGIGMCFVIGFRLQCRRLDPEPVVQLRAGTPKHPIVVSDSGDDQMGGERGLGHARRPGVEVMHVGYIGQAHETGAHSVDSDPFRHGAE